MPMTVAELRQFLETCGDHDQVVISATLANGAVLGVRDVDIGTDQGGPDGEGFEVVLTWDPGAEVVTAAGESL